MMRSSPGARALLLATLTSTSLVAPAARAYTLWSTSATHLGAGEFHGPGNHEEAAPVFELVIRNVMFSTDVDFVSPFANNGSKEPNICSQGSGASATGRLSDGTQINENVDSCSLSIGGHRVTTAAIHDGPYWGEQLSVALTDGEVVLGMDFALDWGADRGGVVKMPFIATTGEVTIPLSLQTQNGKEGVNRAGQYSSGTRLRGRVGDFNKDGWIDGTMLTVGTLPLSSPHYPGQPFLIIRHFETDIPVNGQHAGNVKALSRIQLPHNPVQQ